MKSRANKLLLGLLLVLLGAVSSRSAVCDVLCSLDASLPACHLPSAASGPGTSGEPATMAMGGHCPDHALTRSPATVFAPFKSMQRGECHVQWIAAADRISAYSCALTGQWLNEVAAVLDVPWHENRGTIGVQPPGIPAITVPLRIPIRV